MKKILLITLMLVGLKTFAQDAQPAPTLFPVIDGRVMYQQVVEVPGASAGELHLKALEWYTANINGKYSNLVSSEASINQLKIVSATTADEWTVVFDMQIDSKDGKFRYQISNIRSTVTGQEGNVLFRKYVVDVPADLQNQIVTGEAKGYSKGQRKNAQKSIIKIDDALKSVGASLTKAMTYKPKAADF